MATIPEPFSVSSPTCEFVSVPESRNELAPVLVPAPELVPVLTPRRGYAVPVLRKRFPVHEFSPGWAPDPELSPLRASFAEFGPERASAFDQDPVQAPAIDQCPGHISALDHSPVLASAPGQGVMQALAPDQSPVKAPAYDLNPRHCAVSSLSGGPILNPFPNKSSSFIASRSAALSSVGISTHITARSAGPRESSSPVLARSAISSSSGSSSLVTTRSDVLSFSQECNSQWIQFLCHDQECHSVNFPRHGQESRFSFNGGQIPNPDSCTLVVISSILVAVVSAMDAPYVCSAKFSNLAFGVLFSFQSTYLPIEGYIVYG